MEFTLQDIDTFEQRFRATFINSLGGFKSLALIGTKSESGTSNLAVFNSFFHLGAYPPLFGFVVRPDSVERHTLDNIQKKKCFTVNHVSEEFYQKAHQTSARYPADVSEFKEVKLNEEYRKGFYAPFVQESNVKIGAEMHDIIPVTVNGTLIVIGKIVTVSLPEDVLGEDGFVDLCKAGSLSCTGLDAYYTADPVARLSYAKPGTWPRPLDQN